MKKSYISFFVFVLCIFFASQSLAKESPENIKEIEAFLIQELDSFPASIKGRFVGCKRICENKKAAEVIIGTEYKLIIDAIRGLDDVRYYLDHTSNQHFSLLHRKSPEECFAQIVPAFRTRKAPRDRMNMLFDTMHCVPSFYKGWEVTRSGIIPGCALILIGGKYEIAVENYEQTFIYTFYQIEKNGVKIFECESLEKAMEQIPRNLDYKGSCSW